MELPRRRGGGGRTASPRRRHFSPSLTTPGGFEHEQAGGINKWVITRWRLRAAFPRPAAAWPGGREVEGRERKRRGGCGLGLHPHPPTSPPVRKEVCVSIRSGNENVGSELPRRSLGPGLINSLFPAARTGFPHREPGKEPGDSGLRERQLLRRRGGGSSSLRAGSCLRVSSTEAEG